MKNTVLAVCLLLAPFHYSFAQNDVSPYSILGIGDVESSHYGRWLGMAGAGVALSSNRYLNQANAASLSRLDNQFFVFEVSGRYKYTNYLNASTTGANIHSDDLSMRKLALGIKLAKNWGTGVGLQPFSLSNYSFYSKKTVQGSNYQTQAYNQGSGGLTQVYWANSYAVTKNLSLGLQTGYLFGSLNQQETITALGTSLVTSRNIYMRSPYFTYSAQYNGKITPHWRLALGGTYAAKTTLNAEYSVSVTENNVTLLNETVTANTLYNIPKSFSTGAALIHDKGFTLAVDYKAQHWSSTNYKGVNYALVNSNRLSAGVQVSKRVQAFGVPLERVYYQAGVFHSNAYLQLNGRQLTDYGVTLGIGGNSLRNSLGYQLSLELGTKGTTRNNLIKQQYSQLNFTLSYRDFWFTKGRKYD